MRREKRLTALLPGNAGNMAKSMRKKKHDLKRNHYNLAFSDGVNDQIMDAMQQNESFSFLRPCQFIRHLVLLGLKEHLTQEKNRTTRLENRLEAVGCETAEAQTQTAVKAQGGTNKEIASGYYRGAEIVGNIIFPKWE
jgi:hypothetical protein